MGVECRQRAETEFHRVAEVAFVVHCLVVE